MRERSANEKESELTKQDLKEKRREVLSRKLYLSREAMNEWEEETDRQAREMKQREREKERNRGTEGSKREK